MLECAERIACGFVTAQVLSSYKAEGRKMASFRKGEDDVF